jgi:hypothetical protein
LISPSNFFVPQVNLPGSMATFVMPAGVPVRAMSGGMGQTLETDKPWYQQLWDQVTDPFGTNATVLSQQSAQLTSQVNQAAGNVGQLFTVGSTSFLLLVVGGLLLFVVLAGGRR